MIVASAWFCWKISVKNNHSSGGRYAFMESIKVDKLCFRQICIKELDHSEIKIEKRGSANAHFHANALP